MAARLLLVLGALLAPSAPYAPPVRALAPVPVALNVRGVGRLGTRLAATPAESAPPPPMADGDAPPPKKRRRRRPPRLKQKNVAEPERGGGAAVPAMTDSSLLGGPAASPAPRKKRRPPMKSAHNATARLKLERAAAKRGPEGGARRRPGGPPPPPRSRGPRNRKRNATAPAAARGPPPPRRAGRLPPGAPGARRPFEPLPPTKSAPPPKKRCVCGYCGEIFSSRSKLFRHLREANDCRKIALSHGMPLENPIKAVERRLRRRYGDLLLAGCIVLRARSPTEPGAPRRVAFRRSPKGLILKADAEYQVVRRRRRNRSPGRKAGPGYLREPLYLAQIELVLHDS